MWEYHPGGRGGTKQSKISTPGGGGGEQNSQNPFGGIYVFKIHK